MVCCLLFGGCEQAARLNGSGYRMTIAAPPIEPAVVSEFISRCGKLTAPGMWPAMYASRERASLISAGHRHRGKLD
jgi:hypothetical protein